MGLEGIWGVVANEEEGVTGGSDLKCSRGFPGGPVGKTPHSQCRGPGFDPRLGN